MLTGKFTNRLAVRLAVRPYLVISLTDKKPVITGYNRLVSALKNPFKMHLKTSKTMKIWLSYEKFTKFLNFHEYFHKYVKSPPNLTFLGSLES